MKKLAAFLVIAFVSSQLIAQMRFNPQIGLSMMNVGNPPAGVNFDGKAGVSIGADLRVGGRFQIIPGAHFLSTVSAYSSSTAGNSTIITGDVKTNYIKLKALADYNIIDGSIFKFRANFGPSYDFLVSKKSSVLGNVNSGDFFLQGGLGIDVLFLTADVGYAQALTNKFESGAGKSRGVYINLGIVL